MVNEEGRIVFTVLSHEGELEFVDPKDTQGDFGHTYQDELLIRIKQGLPKDLLGTTLLHELIHIIELLTHTQFKEREVDALALGIYSFLKENPHLREVFFGDVTDDGGPEAITGPPQYQQAEVREGGEFCSWAEKCSPPSAGYTGVMGVEPTIGRPSGRRVEY